MDLVVEIDRHSGFCGGVIRAIGKAERYLSSEGQERLYSLGAIVHNEAELERLRKQGLVTVGKEDLDRLDPGSTLLIRAHGEPPGTYRKAEENGLRLIDCTCPVVLQLQRSIREAYARLHKDGRNGRIIIFGKIGHAEVLGLLGQVGGDALVVENDRMLESLIAEGKIDFSEPVEIFSQTTKSPDGFEAICRILRAHTDRLVIHNTICSQVATRHEKLIQFAGEHDLLLFVSGKESSNGKVLSQICRDENPRTYVIGSPGEIRREWFREGERVGICGATSTPKWLLEEVAEAVRNL